MPGFPQPQYSVNFSAPDRDKPTEDKIYTVTYSPYEKHRNGQKPKSQWKDDDVNRVTMEIEKDIFRDSMSKGWYETEDIVYKKKKYPVFRSPSGRAWGFLVDENNNRRVIGNLNNYKRETDDLHFCVFEEGNPNLWHGYPANFKLERDRPTDRVYKMWREAKFLTKAKIIKIKSGSVCTI